MHPAQRKFQVSIPFAYSSRGYGIHKAGSDVDLKGVAIPPRAYFLGFLKVFE